MKVRVHNQTGEAQKSTGLLTAKPGVFNT